MTCGAGFGVASTGMLMDVGISTALTCFAFAVATSLSLFKQDDLKSFKLNSGNDVDDVSTPLQKKFNFEIVFSFAILKHHCSLTLHLVSLNSIVLGVHDALFQ